MKGYDMMDKTWLLAGVEFDDGDIVAAMLPDGSLVSIDAVPEGLSPLDVVRRWDEFAPLLMSWRPEAANKLVGGRLVAPIRYPAKLLLTAANYPDHRVEFDVEEGEGAAGRVYLFFKPPTTSIIGDRDEVLIRGVADAIDWEAEVAVVIGKRGRFIDREDALDHIAGYTLVNDISARGAFEQPRPEHPAVQYDWIAHKAQDTHCPIGPGMLPAWFVDDPDDIPFTLTLNGVVEQSGNTKDLIHDIRAIVSSASEYMTLEPGDIIATGTCGGVGAGHGRYMVDGDVVVVASPLLGTLTNTIRDIRRLAT